MNDDKSAAQPGAWIAIGIAIGGAASAASAARTRSE